MDTESSCVNGMRREQKTLAQSELFRHWLCKSFLIACYRKVHYSVNMWPAVTFRSFRLFRLFRLSGFLVVSAFRSFWLSGWQNNRGPRPAPSVCTKHDFNPRQATRQINKVRLVWIRLYWQEMYVFTFTGKNVNGSVNSKGHQKNC